MIDKLIYTKEYINKKRIEYKCDPILLERTIFAFGLLEAIVKSGLDFIFKGGSSLLLLFEKPLRLSTDIDIIVSTNTDIISYIKKTSTIYPFIRYEENIRIGVNNIEKRHFRFFYRSITEIEREIPILLDVLFEENNYSSLIKKEIKNDIIKTSNDAIYVKMPSPESLLGDKLTAFAPTTIGVRPKIEKNNGDIVNKQIETIKQFFDVASLFDIIENFEEVVSSYYCISKSEIDYRGQIYTVEDCLKDTFSAAVSIISKGKIDGDNYIDYFNGIKGIKRFLINSDFNAETVVRYGAKVMYISACVLKRISIIKNIPKQELLNGKYSKLNFIKKIDENSFNMAAYAVKLMGEN